MAVLAAGAAVALTAAPAVADPVVLQPGELVVNGGAEQPVTVGWTGGLSRATHGAGGYPAAVIVGPGGATGATYPGGIGLFTGGNAGSTVATQRIDLTPSAAAIDNGNVTARLSAYLGGYTNQQDNARLSYSFRDASDLEVGLVTFGPVMAPDRGNVAGFVPFAQNQVLPVGTRSVVLTLSTQRFVAPANDGYSDNISLILDAPSPIATADTDTTTQGVPVTLSPSANDTPGAGAAIVPTSVRLLNGTTPVTSLTTSDGAYTVDVATGLVTFTPVATFSGTAASVPYRVTDSSGQIDDSTITITVDFVAAPALTVVKSASPADPASFTLGTVITYTFVVRNTGNIAIDGIVIDEVAFSGSDPLPAAVCAASTLAPGAQTTCTTSYTLTAADVAALGVDNTATATGTPSGFGTTITSGPSTFEVPVVPAPAISLVKSVDAAGATAADDVVTYSFLVTNTGNVAVDTIAIAETAFDGTGTSPAVVCPATVLAPGATTTCTGDYTLTQADVDAGSVTNTATADAVPASGGTVTSSASTASLVIAPAPALTFAKSADRSTVTASGQSIGYTFRLVNAGNVTLSNPVVTESGFTGAGTLGAITCPSATIAPGAALDCTATYVTVAADLAEASIFNSASATADDPSASTITSAISSVSIAVDPVVPVDPAAPDAGGVLGVTGVDVVPTVLTGFALLAAGAGLLAVLLVRRRARARRAG